MPFNRWGASQLQHTQHVIFVQRVSTRCTWACSIASNQTARPQLRIAAPLLDELLSGLELDGLDKDALGAALRAGGIHPDMVQDGSHCPERVPFAHTTERAVCAELVAALKTQWLVHCLLQHTYTGCESGDSHQDHITKTTKRSTLILSEHHYNELHELPPHQVQKQQLSLVKNLSLS